MRALLHAMLLVLPVGAVAAEFALTGSWSINHEATAALAEPYDEGSGMRRNPLRGRVTVMGVPLPGTARHGPMSTLAAKDPQVLRCTEMRIAVEDDDVRVQYDGQTSEVMRRGEYRGRRTRLSSSRIEQRYKTPERTVTRKWSLRDDGRLLVSVKLDPRGDKARTYKRVFDRVDPALPDG